MNTNYVIQSAQVGEIRPAILYAAGPSSYSQANGDPVYNPGAGEYITFPMSATSLSGNYTVTFDPASAGYGIVRAGAPSPSQSGWTARWFFNNINGTFGVGKVAQNAAGTGMTPGTYPITFSGGTDTVAATGTVTVSATAVTAVSITNPGIYTVLPTATIGGTPGGTPATLTVTASAPYQEVPTGSNLSGETLQFGAFTSEF